MINALSQNKEKYVSVCTDIVQTFFPERTTEYDKCSRDLGFIYDALLKDIENETDENIRSMSAMFWHAGKCQLKQPEVELKVYDYLLKLVVADIPEVEERLRHLIAILKKTVLEGPSFKLGNTCDIELVHKIHNLAQNRHNWKPLEGDKPTDEHLELILKAAAGMTPALSNEYNYRVDEVPDHLKETLFTSVINFSEAAAESGNTTYATDKNEQLMAPTVICFSLRYNPSNNNIEQFCGDMTVRDPNLLNIGVSVWNAVLTAEALGYKTSFCQMTNWKRDKCKEILGLHSDEPQSEFLTKRNGECTFMPMFFLAIGTEGRVNINTRCHKTENIVNTLRFND